MIQDVVSGSMWVFSPTRSAVAIADLTLTVPTTTGVRVYAELMLTSYSQGWDPGGVGSASSRIVRGAVMGPGGLAFEDIPADPMNNSAYFNKCLAVDFRCGSALAEATYNANVWFHAPPAAPAPRGKPSKLAWIVKVEGTGIAGYSRRIVGYREFLPRPEDAERETLVRAAEVLEVPVRRLSITRVRDGVQPRPRDLAEGAPRLWTR